MVAMTMFMRTHLWHPSGLGFNAGLYQVELAENQKLIILGVGCILRIRPLLIKRLINHFVSLIVAQPSSRDKPHT